MNLHERALKRVFFSGYGSKREADADLSNGAPRETKVHELPHCVPQKGWLTLAKIRPSGYMRYDNYGTDLRLDLKSTKRCFDYGFQSNAVPVGGLRDLHQWFGD